MKFVKWHPHRNQLFSASYDDTIKSWVYEPSVDDWLCSFTMSGHESTVWQLDFDGSGEYLASCGEDRNWMIWRITQTTYESKGMISNLHSRSIYSCSWSTLSLAPATTIDLIATVSNACSILHLYLGWSRQ